PGVDAGDRALAAGGRGVAEAVEGQAEGLPVAAIEEGGDADVRPVLLAALVVVLEADAAPGGVAEEADLHRQERRDRDAADDPVGELGAAARGAARTGRAGAALVDLRRRRGRRRPGDVGDQTEGEREGDEEGAVEHRSTWHRPAGANASSI